MTIPITKIRGKWVSASERLPKTTGIKCTLTADKFFGLATFNGEWVHLLPTFVGEVAYWFEFVNIDGDEIEFVTDPTPIKKKRNVKMKQSAGTIIVNENLEILMGHVTNSMPEIWDLPKGMVEDNESYIDAAIRECKEEFGINLDKNKLVEIGNCKYNSQKNIWVFMTFVKKDDVDLSSLKCNSMYMDSSSKEHPEIDGYRWMKFSDIPYDCAKSMNKLLHELRTKIHDFVRYSGIDK